MIVNSIELYWLYEIWTYVTFVNSIKNEKNIKCFFLVYFFCMIFCFLFSSSIHFFFCFVPGVLFWETQPIMNQWSNQPLSYICVWGSVRSMMFCRLPVSNCPKTNHSIMHIRIRWFLLKYWFMDAFKSPWPRISKLRN